MTSRKATISSRITLTRALAFASGMDAANRQMRAANRAAWNLADRNLATETTNRLLRHVPFEVGGLMGLPEELLAKLAA